MKIMASKGVHLIAHRGWSVRFPENSFPAFAASIAAGADEIEFDVRVSADGVPFVIHDGTIDRTTDGSGAVADMTASELRHVNLIDVNGDVLSGLKIPSLLEVLKTFAPHISLNIHIKSIDERSTPLHLMASLDLAAYKPFYIAGNSSILEKALQICPHIPRCLIQGRTDTDMGAVFATAKRLNCERIQFFKGYYQDEDIKTCVDKGFIPNLYWADEKEEAELAFKKGVLGLLTNDIGPIRQHLLENGFFSS